MPLEMMFQMPFIRMGGQADGAFGEMGVIGCINGFELLTG
ncbi:hypothetical protein XMA121_002250 [Marinobacterium sp. xm-a-121]|jgi:hypothetical protein|nr:hypothetical protein [Marinobacterium sp. xm-g-48]NRP27969.1 hypothetical protein [Marinobacterium sp. xm-d-420]NRP39614.1 hypothetical protein [Marinobacterium sp. xm-a-121]NRP53513.1 hypothetical protein [Marinobacterium sp. xm-v-242]NRP56772.1 hypothetical protein [Marinobacterium sp. xm-d-510]NRP77763.1 hypothetical protein [Marinobacterium sp. xm-m-383]NRP82377.1 hypothetical protein [Marinobacterium sp. xm-d-509]NRP95355.1 hypothetical protein [Marinobacterium sp. xm-g-59]NRP96439.